MTSFGATTTTDEVAAALRTEIKGKNGEQALLNCECNKFLMGAFGFPVLITGVTLGSLGAEVARVLAKYAALVVVAGRNKEKWVDMDYVSFLASVHYLLIFSLDWKLLSRPSKLRLQARTSGS